MIKIKSSKTKVSEKGQATIGMLIFFPVLMLMVMTVLYAGYPIYLKLAAQNAAYSFAMETSRAPGYNFNAMNDVGTYVVNRTPGMTTWAKQTLLFPSPIFFNGSDDPNSEFIMRTSMNGQVTIVPNGENNPLLHMSTVDPSLAALWNQLITGSAFGPRPTFMRCDNVGLCWTTRSGADQSWSIQ
jgi:Flp pilus assembly protein TadG